VSTPTKNQFEIDVTRIRAQAREHMDAGPVTETNNVDIGRLIEVLNEVIATEVVCYLRYSQHGGDPDFNPATLAERSHTEYVTTDESDLKRMLEENLVAERIVISSYQEIIRWIGDADPTTRRLMEKILEQEEHADDLNDLLGN
jgi:bacterioferritin